MDTKKIYSKVVGVSFSDRQDVIKTLKPEDPLFLSREKDNKFDVNAIKVETATQIHIGYLKKELAAELSPNIDSGKFTYVAKVKEVTGIDKQTRGCNIIIEEIPVVTI